MKAAQLIIPRKNPLNRKASQSDRLSCRDMGNNVPTAPICLKPDIFSKKTHS